MSNPPGVITRVRKTARRDRPLRPNLFVRGFEERKTEAFVSWPISEIDWPYKKGPTACTTWFRLSSDFNTIQVWGWTMIHPSTSLPKLSLEVPETRPVLLGILWLPCLCLHINRYMEYTDSWKWKMSQLPQSDRLCLPSIRYVFKVGIQWLNGPVEVCFDDDVGYGGWWY
jgi:hypothetical protein